MAVMDLYVVYAGNTGYPATSSNAFNFVGISLLQVRGNYVLEVKVRMHSSLKEDHQVDLVDLQDGSRLLRTRICLLLFLL